MDFVKIPKAETTKIYKKGKLHQTLDYMVNIKKAMGHDYVVADEIINLSTINNMWLNHQVIKEYERWYHVEDENPEGMFTGEIARVKTFMIITNNSKILVERDRFLNALDDFQLKLLGLSRD